MESKLELILENIKKKGLMNNVLNSLNLQSLDSLKQVIDKQIYSYIESLRIFLTRLFEKCYGYPLSEFNKLPLEVLLFFVNQKEKELKDCYYLIKKNHIYFRLKKIPSEEDYRIIIKILSVLGENLEKIYRFKKRYQDFLQNLRIKLESPVDEEKISPNYTKENNKKKFLLLPLILVIFLSIGGLGYFLFLTTSEIEKLKVKVEELEKNNKFPVLKSKVSAFEITVNSFKREIETLNQKYAKVEKETNALRKKYQSWRWGIKNLEGKYRQLMKELQELKREIQNFNSVNQELRREVQGLKKEIQQLEGKIQDIIKRIEKLEKTQASNNESSKIEEEKREIKIKKSKTW